jgi:putative tricarboxylic transport membrane protein
MPEPLTAAANALADPLVWGVVLAAAAYGVLIGSMPGLTATMGVALFVPVTFWLPPLPALAGIATMVACAIFAGDIPTTLLRIPGTPASAAYADEAHGLARRGRASLALGMALVASVTGGLGGAAVLMLVGHQLASLATWFSVAEYFWLYATGLSCAVLVAPGRVSLAVIALAIGLLFSTVGLSSVHAEPRFTFGLPELLGGIGFIPAMVGLFGMAEVLRTAIALPTRADSSIHEAATTPGSLVLPALRRLADRPGDWLRSTGIGVVIGVLPGAGADIASWVAAAASRALGRQGTGDERDVERIADGCTANSASLAAAWIPALVFGIPGDSVTAMVIGVLAMKNLTAGPEVFTQQAPLVYGLYACFMLANLMLLPVGLVAIRAATAVMRVPQRILLPVIVMLCVVGSFSINGSLFDVGLMLAFGLVGLACDRLLIPVGPMVLGIILGGPVEERFIQTLAGGRGSPWAFVDRPVSAGLALAFLALWALYAAKAWAAARSSWQSRSWPGREREREAGQR